MSAGLPSPRKVYLGDGAYAQFDGHHVIVTAENGIIATDTVFLDGPTLQAFLRFVAALGVPMPREAP